MTEPNYEELLQMVSELEVSTREHEVKQEVMSMVRNAKKREKETKRFLAIERIIGKTVYGKLTSDMSQFPHDAYERFVRDYGEADLLNVIHILAQMVAKEFQERQQDPDEWFERWNRNADNQYRQDMDFIKWSKSMLGEGMDQ